MHQSQTSGGDSKFPHRMGYTGLTHGGRAADRAPGRQFMADEHTPGDETTEPNPTADRPAPRSPWEPAQPAGPSPWATEQSPWSAPAGAPPPSPPPPPPPSPGPAEPAAAAEPAPVDEATDNPLASPDAWVNPLAEEEARGAALPADVPPVPTPPPAWQIGSPNPPAWGEPAVVAAPPQAAGRRSFLLAAATGAVVGALVAG